MTKVVEDDIHFRILRILEQHPEISQRELAGEVGIALGKVNYVLNALTDKGLVKIRNFRNSQNKLRYAYVLTPAGLSKRAELTSVFLRRKMAEYDALKAEIEDLKRETSKAKSTAGRRS
ncbi:MarR family EPS-associated transcriptional regulator [Seohaeicola saemankumensis]|uniref:MarR family EPS-associated transcriptional regulator n=1 Tax=Seohaeicola saemankumensis TaxID=481181 RepID=A0ABW3TE17_9RHOB